MNNIYSVTPTANFTYQQLTSNLAIMGAKIVSSSNDSVKIESDEYDAKNIQKCRFVGSVSICGNESNKAIPSEVPAKVEAVAEKPKTPTSFFGIR